MRTAMAETVVFASKCSAVLDSDVYAGGGTDDTQALQAILDRAQTDGKICLVLDGAARISKSLRIYSNTTIICPDKSCGLFLSDGANCSVLCNAHKDMKTIQERNINLFGGVYNHNSAGQVHHREWEEETFGGSNWVFGMEFFGVEQVLFRDVTIANQRTFALLMANWKNVTMENIHIDRRERMDGENQDGLHFWGPGRFLTLRNIRGNSGDDFIALAPDEHDLTSSIEDVLIDGVMLDDADQGIRLLSRGEGRLDRVVIRNVTGTYKSYGFIVNPWFSGSGGRYGNIVFDTIDLRPLKNNYNYAPPFLFKLGGRIESLTVKNLYHHKPDYPHKLFVIGGAYMKEQPELPEEATCIDRLMVDGVYIDEDNPAGIEESYMTVFSCVRMLSLQNILLHRAEGLPRQGVFLRVQGGSIDTMVLQHINAPDLSYLVDAPEGSIASTIGGTEGCI